MSLCARQRCAQHLAAFVCGDRTRACAPCCCSRRTNRELLAAWPSSGLAVESILAASRVTATQQTLRFGRPIWVRDAIRGKQRYPSLSGNHATSVAIVGGGMTGALVAHAFASAGIPTTVLEGGALGRGSTAASSALLLQEPDLELTELTNRYGTRTSRRMWQMSRDSVHA